MSEPVEAAEFAALMHPLGPFEAHPSLAVAVSGGVDSVATLLLAQEWARLRGGTCLALLVDHGLRANSADEAQGVRERLGDRGIACRILAPIIAPGSALAARARAARYGVLETACAESGILHLLLGHHAADQAETVVMRLLRGSGPDGLAGMSALVETRLVRLLRPLLTVAPARLRATAQCRGLEWVDDPSNRDPASLRARLRALRDDPDGTAPATTGLVRAAAARGYARVLREAADAAWLGRHALLHPDGHAVLDAVPATASALGHLVRVVAGSVRPPRERIVRNWLARPRPATLGGVILRPTRGSPGGWRLEPEPAASQAPRGTQAPWQAISSLAGAGFVVARPANSAEWPGMQNTPGPPI